MSALKQGGNMNFNPVRAAAASGGTTSDPAAATGDMFMKILTAQLQNQSPLDPVDPTQFAAQLVQLNMLDQLTQIRSLLQKLA
jgi:flagellar basal-body rod modification protein FlgD